MSDICRAAPSLVCKDAPHDGLWAPRYPCVLVIDAMARWVLSSDMEALKLWHCAEGPDPLLLVTKRGEGRFHEDRFLAAANRVLRRAVEHGVKWVQALQARSFVIIATLSPAAALLLHSHLCFAEHLVPQVLHPSWK
jgi:hypothetical protein